MVSIYPEDTLYMGMAKDSTPSACCDYRKCYEIFVGLMQPLHPHSDQREQETELCNMEFLH